MAFNSGFAADSGVENFYNNSVDFGKLSGSAAVQKTMDELNAIKRNSGTFNAIMGADAKSEMDKLTRQGQQTMHDANIFSQNLMSGAQLVSGGIKGFGKAGGFDNLFGGGPGKVATLDSTPMTVENAYGSSVSYYDPNIYTGVGDF